MVLSGKDWLVAEGNSRSLHYAPPDFLWNLVALSHFMRPSLRKGAHAALSSAAWQEIRVRSGRDDKGEGIPSICIGIIGWAMTHAIILRGSHGTFERLRETKDLAATAGC